MGALRRHEYGYRLVIVNKYTFHEPTQVPVMVLTAAAIPFATTERTATQTALLAGYCEE